MKSVALVFMALVLLTTQSASATTVTFTVPPAFVGPSLSGDIDFFSSDLDGIALQGQSLSLDLVFADEILGRVFFGTTSVGFLLIVHTDAGTFPGFAGSTTSFLLAPDGSAASATFTAGLSQGSNGTFSMGLVDIRASNAPANPLDISGVHFDTIFPNTGFQVTDAQFRMSINATPDDPARVVFGTAQQLPEPSSAVLLLVGLLGIGVAMARRGV